MRPILSKSGYGLILCLSILLWCSSVWAVQVSWQAPTTRTDGTPATAAGFNLYYRQAGQTTYQRIDVGLRTTYPLEGLTVGQTYNFYVTAYDTSDRESAPSIVVSATIANPPAARAPVANNDTVSTPEDRTVTTGNVLANDTDANGDALSIVSFTQPTRGSVVRNGTTAFTYTPPANFSGTASFTYTIRDPGGLTATGTVAVTVTAVNDAPVARADSATTAAGTAVTISVLANDSDADNDPLTVSATTTASRGTVTRSTNTVTYRPNTGFTGTNSFTYTVSDGRGSTAIGTVTVIVTAATEVNIWLEAEQGQLQSPMARRSDTTTSGGQYVWVPESAQDLLDPLAPGGVAEYRFTVPQTDFYVIWGRARPNTAGEGSFFVGVDVQGSSAGTVTGVSPTTYVVAPLRVGDRYYIDRSYTITAMPSALAGLVGIKTANNDKANQSATWLRFTLTQAATLYVAYDARATRYPTWLTSAYTNTGQRLTTTDTPLAIWRRAVAAGTVTLPGNLYGNPQGVASNYVVLLDFDDNVQDQYLVWQLSSQQASEDSGEVSVVSPTTYVAASLDVGDRYYIDRTHTITAMPSALAGLVGIKTANNDKANQSATLLRFSLTQPATLYVAYDTRATRYPTWLTASYTNTGQRLTTTDVPLSLWRREVTAGTVTLPGNLYGNPQGVYSNYVVLLDFQEDDAASPWVWEEMAGDTTPVFQLEAGEHILRIKQRDSGTQLDRLLITTDMNVVPQD